MTSPLEPHSPKPAYPVEAKVKAASLTAAVTALVMTLLGTYVWRGAAVPEWVEPAVTTVVTAAATFIAGYWARHTPRP